MKVLTLCLLTIVVLAGCGGQKHDEIFLDRIASDPGSFIGEKVAVRGVVIKETVLDTNSTDGSEAIIYRLQDDDTTMTLYLSPEQEKAIALSKPVEVKGMVSRDVDGEAMIVPDTICIL